MTPEEFHRQKGKKPTHSPMRLLEMIHADDIDKEGLEWIVEHIEREAARFLPSHLRLLRRNCQRCAEKLTHH